MKNKIILIVNIFIISCISKKQEISNDILRDSYNLKYQTFCKIYYSKSDLISEFKSNSVDTNLKVLKNYCKTYLIDFNYSDDKIIDLLDTKEGQYSVALIIYDKAIRQRGNIVMMNGYQILAEVDRDSVYFSLRHLNVYNDFIMKSGDITFKNSEYYAGAPCVALKDLKKDTIDIFYSLGNTSYNSRFFFKKNLECNKIDISLIKE